MSYRDHRVGWKTSDKTPYTDTRKMKCDSNYESRHYNSSKYHNLHGLSSNLVEIFNKRFTFFDSPENPIARPPHIDDIFTSPPFSIDALKDVKESLNRTRCKLDAYEITKWGKHTAFTNRSSRIIRAIRHQIAPELCTVAWLKMYEIICSYPKLIPSDISKLHSVHLCEAPGAFICCLNHYIKTKRKSIEWDWTANTLNPYFEGNSAQAMIDDVRLINETFDHWNFGKDNSGNIMNQENIRDLWQSTKNLPVYLVTADGSVDCHHVPNEQEHYTAPLHYCEMVCALGLLRKNGGFVIKLFNLFEHSTAGMLYILKAHFEELHIFKPVTSKPGNSETYAIAIGFKGIDNNLLEHLLSFIEKGNGINYGKKNIFNEFCLIPEQRMTKDFIHQFCECSTKFKDFQQNAIEENIGLWNNGKIPFKQKRIINAEKDWVTIEWFNKYSIERLDSRFFLSSSIKLNGDQQ